VHGNLTRDLIVVKKADLGEFLKATNRLVKRNMSHSMAMDCDCPATRDAGLCSSSMDYENWDEEIYKRIEEVRIHQHGAIFHACMRDIFGGIPGSTPCFMAPLLGGCPHLPGRCVVSLQSLLETPQIHMHALRFFLRHGAKLYLKIPLHPAPTLVARRERPCHPIRVSMQPWCTVYSRPACSFCCSFN
jgi:hypothetical protein